MKKYIKTIRYFITITPIQGSNRQVSQRQSYAEWSFPFKASENCSRSFPIGFSFSVFKRQFLRDRQ